jgi:hypothetical protein
MGGQERGAAIVGLKERDVLKTCNGLPYKVYNSVPVVLYLKRQRRSHLRDYLLMLAVNARFSHGLVQMVQYGPI